MGQCTTHLVAVHALDMEIFLQGSSNLEFDQVAICLLEFWYSTKF